MKKNPLIITVIIFIFICIALVIYCLLFVFDREDEETIKTTTVSLSSGFRDALDKAEQAKNENQILREQLLEQGYPEETLDGLLASGARRAVQLPYIAAVKEKYGASWNIPLVTGDFTLVDLYVVGDSFVLGYYEDSSLEKVIWLHMSVTESYENLQAGLKYAEKALFDDHVRYIDDNGNIVGFSFWVSQDATVTRYVATSSSAMTTGDINCFIGSIVDGELGQTSE